MKKFILVLGGLMLLLSWTSMAFALTPLAGDFLWRPSFRSVATANIFEDDWDYVQDPIAHHRVEGYRLYTNLSNLIDTGEELLGDRSANKYLFGLSGNPLQSMFDLPIRNTFVLYLDKTTNFDNWSQITTDYLDLNGDFRYDVRDQLFTNQTTDDAVSNNAWLLTTNYEYSDYSWIGLNLYKDNVVDADLLGRGLFRYGTLFPAGTLTGGDEHILTDLSNNEVYLTEHDNRDFSTEDKRPMFAMHIAYGVERDEDSSWRADLIFASLKNEQLTEDIHSFWYDFSANTDSIANQQEYIEKATEKDKNNRMRVTIGGAIERQLNERTRTEFECYLTNTRGSIDYNYFVEYDNLEMQTVGGNLERTTDVNKFNEVHDGDYTSYAIDLNNRNWFELDERVRFGIGARIHLEKRKDSYDWTIEEEMNQTFNDGDAETLDNDDYTRVITDSEKGIYIADEKISSISFPVGLEYVFTKNEKWTMRF